MEDYYFHLLEQIDREDLKNCKRFTVISFIKGTFYIILAINRGAKILYTKSMDKEIQNVSSLTLT